jgi:glycosyltransferase involved in cell wall biosynthesis
MKVLHCITGLSGDGAQRMLLRLAKGLSPLGIESCVVSLRSDGELAHAFCASGIRVEMLSMEGVKGVVPAFVRLRRLIRGWQPDLVQGWMYHANVVATAARDLSGSTAPVCWNVRRGLDDFKARKRSTQSIIQASRWMSRRAAHIVYCSHTSREQHTRIGFADSRTSVMGNGFDTERFAPSESVRREMREALGFKSSDFVVGTFGRYDVAKGHRYLLDAFVQVAERAAHMKLLLVGRGLGPGNSALSLADFPEHVRTRIHVERERDDIERLYPALDLYCSPSISEGFPNVVGEAAASGLPILASDTGATAELVWGSGIVVRPRSVSELARGLTQLVCEDEGTRRRRGERARQRIIDSYSLGAVVRAYERLYTSLLGDSGAPGTSAEAAQ